MYWLRTGSLLSFFPWLLSLTIWTFAGLIIYTSVFNLERKERLIVGFILGMGLYLFLLNLFGRWFEPAVAFWFPNIILLIFCGAVILIKKESAIDFKDLSSWPIVIIAIILALYFVFIERGLGIFDDRKNLSIISLMANGDIPVHFFLNPTELYGYHYGSQLLGASLVRLGGLFPWSAFDLSKSISWALTIVLVFFIANRYLDTKKSILTAFLFIFLSGTRYLLMFLPENNLQFFDAYVDFQGISQDMMVPFSKSLFQPLEMGGGPPNPYLFGFLTGFRHPHIMEHAGTWSFAQVLIFVIWLLADRVKNNYAIPIFTILFSLLALSWESSYGLILIGVFSIFFLLSLRRNQKSNVSGMLFYAALLSIPVVLLQGGSITELAKQLISSLGSQTGATYSYAPQGSIVSFQWPPALFSAHFGSLSFFSIPQLILVIFDLGPIIFFVPFLIQWGLKQIKNNDWPQAVIQISAIAGFFLPVFISYDRSPRDIGRFFGHAISIWNILALIFIFRVTVKNHLIKVISICSVLLMIVSGLVLGYVQMSAVKKPILAEVIDGIDAHVAFQLWGNFSSSDVILDPGREWRAIVLTGMPTKINLEKDPADWSSFLLTPDIGEFSKAGYNYIYIDNAWWGTITEEYQKEMSQDCIDVILDTGTNDEYQFRKLIDITGCNN